MCFSVVGVLKISYYTLCYTIHYGMLFVTQKFGLSKISLFESLSKALRLPWSGGGVAALARAYSAPLCRGTTTCRIFSQVFGIFASRNLGVLDKRKFAAT